MVIVKSPGGDLERYAVLSVVRLWPHPVRRPAPLLCRHGTAMPYVSRGTRPTGDTAAGRREWERRHDDCEGAQPDDIRSTRVTSWIRCVPAGYTREDDRRYGVALVLVAFGAYAVSRRLREMWPSCFTTSRRRFRLEMP